MTIGECYDLYENKGIITNFIITLKDGKESIEIIQKEED